MKKYIILLFLLIVCSCASNKEQENSLDTDSTTLLGFEEGNGVNLFGDSTILTGNCTKGDCYSGQGTFWANDSSVYDGFFKDGMAHGQGKLTSFDGQYWEGNWILGKLVTGIQYDIYENTIYEGGFSSINTQSGIEFVPHGKGYLKYPDGKIEDGIWNKGEKTGKYLSAPNFSFKKKTTKNEYSAKYSEPKFKNLKMIGKVGRFGIEADNEQDLLFGKIIRALRYQNITKKVEKKYSLPNNILLAMIMQETGGAVALANGLGDGGIGLCHMQGIVADEFGLETRCKSSCKLVCKKHGKYLSQKIEQTNGSVRQLIGIDDRFHPILNIDAAGRMLAFYRRQQKKGLTDIQSAILRYAGRKNYKKYWENINFYQRKLNDQVLIKKVELRFNELNPKFTINGKKGNFEDYLQESQKQNRNYGLDSY